MLMNYSDGTPLRLAPGVPQYMLDDQLIAHEQKLVRRWLPAEIYPYPVIGPDKSWEGRCLAFYGTTMHDPRWGYRLYYIQFGSSSGDSRVMLATSEDGFRWEKPELGLVEWNGSKANNILLAPEWRNDGPSIVYDHDDRAYPYKLLIFSKCGIREPQWDERWGLYGFQSPDSLSWEKVQEGPCLHAGDRTNIMFTKPDGKYRVYTRHKLMFAHTGTRAVYISESSDFTDWHEPELVLRPDLEDDPDVEYYGMSVFERNGWYFGLLEYYRSSVDVIETHLVFSKDGRNWRHPIPRHPFIAATQDWNRKWSTCSSSGPLIINEQLVFYFNGRWVGHGHNTAQQHGVIGYASLPLDRFCALEAASDGQLVTVPIEWPGGDLLINADTRDCFESHPSMSDGEIAVELLDRSGEPVPEWSGQRKAHFAGNTHSRGGIYDGTVRWPNDRSLGALAGQAIRLRFLMRQARLFTLSAAKE
jgi:hypothetical protein